MQLPMGSLEHDTPPGTHRGGIEPHEVQHGSNAHFGQLLLQPSSYAPDLTYLCGRKHGLKLVLWQHG